MELTVKIALMLFLLIVWYQDTKDREVYWFLFPLIGICCAFLYASNSLIELFISSMCINAGFIALLLLVVFAYTSIKMKTSLFQGIGLGDILLFFGLSFSFSSVSFIIIFISALIFSLAVHMVFKKPQSTVPLAGYMSLFFGLTYLAYWLGVINSVYSI